MNSNQKKIAIFSGAGMSAESGIDTFRDQGGLWEKHRLEDVATPEAWARQPEVVLNFYNSRYMQLLKTKPNQAHYDLVRLEEKFDVTIITQNVDDLHERAGSSNVIHLHGELTKCRSDRDENNLIEMPMGGLRIGDLGPDGYQLRPHVIWFGELVPELDRAAAIVRKAEILIVVGTSLNVYPAAGLAYASAPNAEVILIDPGDFESHTSGRFRHIKKIATEGLREITNEIMK